MLAVFMHIYNNESRIGVSQTAHRHHQHHNRCNILHNKHGYNECDNIMADFVGRNRAGSLRHTRCRPTIVANIGRVNRPLRLFDAGAAKQLSILLEGESLLNDGAAIIMYHVFNWMAKDELDSEYSCVVILLVFHFL